VQPDRDAVQVVPVGELDIATVDRLRAAVEELVAVGFERVVIDLRELVFIDCSGLRLLRALYDGARRDDWRLALIQGPAPVRRLFAMTETLALLPFVAPPPPRRLRRAGSMAALERRGRRGRRPRSQH
jgi:anti-anti-sigma factor